MVEVYCRVVRGSSATPLSLWARLVCAYKSINLNCRPAVKLLLPGAFVSMSGCAMDSGSGSVRLLGTGYTLCTAYRDDASHSATRRAKQRRHVEIY